MMDDMVIVDTRVDVLATFSTGSANRACTPVRFRWKKREITITEIGLVHPTSHGKRMVHVFDVTDGAQDYRLEFNAETLTWRLKYVADGTL